MGAKKVVPGSRGWLKPRIDSNTGLTRMIPLTPKEKAFIVAYMRSLDVEKAARAAGYTSKHPDGLYIVGHDLLGTPYIRKIIDEEIAKASLSEESVLDRLNEMATANPDDFFHEVTSVDAQGNITTHKELDWDMVKKKGYLIQELREDQGKFKIKLYDAQQALTLLGKNKKLFSDQLDLKDLGDVIVKIVQGVSHEEL